MLKYEWVLKADQWHITCNNGLSYTIPNHNGMYYLTELLHCPNVEIQYSSLISKGATKRTSQEFQNVSKMELYRYGLHEGNWFSIMPRADKRTIREVAKEIISVKERIEKYSTINDYGKVDTLLSELDMLEDYFKCVYTRKKHLKLFDSDKEKLYYCVKKSIQRIYKLIKSNDTELFSFLKFNIHFYSEYMQMEKYEGVDVRVRRDERRESRDQGLAQKLQK